MASSTAVREMAKKAKLAIVAAAAPTPNSRKAAEFMVEVNAAQSAGDAKETAAHPAVTAAAELMSAGLAVTG